MKEISKDQMEIVKEIRERISKEVMQLESMTKLSRSKIILGNLCGEINSLNRIYTALAINYKLKEEAKNGKREIQ